MDPGQKENLASSRLVLHCTHSRNLPSSDFYVPDSETTEDESEEPVETKEDEDDDVHDQVVHSGTRPLLD